MKDETERDCVLGPVVKARIKIEKFLNKLKKFEQRLTVNQCATQRMTDQDEILTIEAGCFDAHQQNV